MKILYHHRIASKDGQYVHIEELTRALQAMGHEIIMVGPAAVTRLDYGSDSRVVGILKRMIPGFLYELLELGYNLLGYMRITASVRRFRPDVIYERYNLYTPCGVWAAKRYGIPRILEVNAPLFQERSKFGGLSLGRLARWTERYTWRNSDVVLPVTHVLARILEEEGVSEHRIRVIPNGIRRDMLAGSVGSDGANRMMGLEGALVLGFVGFVREWHGLDRVLEFMSESPEPDLHLLLVGDGPARRGLERRAERLGIRSRLTVTGFVGRDAVHDYIAAFDVALQPDVVDYASPLKLFEYMGAGCAILAPEKENIMEVLVHNDNALLFDLNSDDSFRHCLEKLCCDAGLRMRLGRRARETVVERDLTWSGNAVKISDIIASLARPTGPANGKSISAKGAG